MDITQLCFPKDDSFCLTESTGTYINTFFLFQEKEKYITEKILNDWNILFYSHKAWLNIRLTS